MVCAQVLSFTYTNAHRIYDLLEGRYFLFPLKYLLKSLLIHFITAVQVVKFIAGKLTAFRLLCGALFLFK